MDLLVSVLGVPAVLAKRGTTMVPTQKYQQCLVLLALEHPRWVSSAALAEVLWGPNPGRNHPKRIVGSINDITVRAFGTPLIIGLGQKTTLRYRFDPNCTVATDVALFRERSLEIAELSEHAQTVSCYKKAVSALGIWSNQPDDPFPGLLSAPDPRVSEVEALRREVVENYLFAAAQLDMDIAAEAARELEFYPDSPTIWAARIESLHRRGRSKSAIEASRDALAAFGVTDPKRLRYPLSSACLRAQDANAHNGDVVTLVAQWELPTRHDLHDEERWQLLRSLVPQWQGDALPSPTIRREGDPHRYILPIRRAEGMSSEPSEDSPLLSEWVTDCLANGDDAIFLFGETGSGKTWFLQTMIGLLPESLAAGIVDLGASLLPRGHRQWPWDWRSIAESFGNLRGKLLLLDSLDDAVRRSRPGERLTLITSALYPLLEGGRVLLAARPHLFESDERLSTQLDTAAERIASQRRRAVRYSVGYVQRLTPSDIKRHLAHEWPEESRVLWDRLVATRGLMDLASHPILLPMVAQSIYLTPGGDKGIPATPGRLYRVYTEHLLSMDAERSGLPEAAARRFLEDLSLHLLNAGLGGIVAEDLPRVAPTFFQDREFPFEREAMTAALRSVTLLTPDIDGRLSFTHPSIGEYFAAEALVRNILKSNRSLELMRFPSKVTDGFALDLLTPVTSRTWTGITVLVSEGESPILRYLAIYLAVRVVQGMPLRDPIVDDLISSILVRLTVETEPFVVRELLVALTRLQYKIETPLISRHLLNPIPREIIRGELQDYYGSLEDARDYLRARLAAVGEADDMQLFYVISLAAIADPSDAHLIRSCANGGTPAIRTVAEALLSELTSQQM